MKIVKFLLICMTPFLVAGCSLGDTGQTSITTEESSAPTANIDFLKSTLLATYDHDKYMSFEEDILVIQTLSEKALNVTTSDEKLSFDETYDSVRYANIEIEINGDTYYLTGENGFEMELKMLSNSVLLDGEGVRYMVQSN